MKKIIAAVILFLVVLTGAAEAVSIRQGSFDCVDEIGSAAFWDNKNVIGISATIYITRREDIRIDLNYDFCTADMEDIIVGEPEINTAATLNKHLVYATARFNILTNSTVTPYLRYDLGIEKTYSYTTITVSGSDPENIVDESDPGLINGLTAGFDIVFSRTISLGMGYNVYYIGETTLSTQYISLSVAL
jgi:hypothetical protein